MSSRAIYTFPLLHEYLRCRAWLFFLAAIAVLGGGACLWWRSFIPAAAAFVFAAAAIYYASVIGRARSSPARIAALEEVTAAQVWFWRITCVALLAALAAQLLRPAA